MLNRGTGDLCIDLARVGMGQGTCTEGLAVQLLKEYPEAEIITGGGVRGVEDLRQFRQAGVSGVLVASALHDGRLTPAEVQALQKNAD